MIGMMLSMSVKLVVVAIIMAGGGGMRISMRREAHNPTRHLAARAGSHRHLAAERTIWLLMRSRREGEGTPLAALLVKSRTPRQHATPTREIGETRGPPVSTREHRRIHRKRSQHGRRVFAV